MSKAEDIVINIPENPHIFNTEIMKFIHLSELTFGYAPDRIRVSDFNDTYSDDRSFRNIASKFIPLLNKKFFTDLYSDRPERERIEGYIPAGRLIILYGLAGVGKTVLAMKICQTLNDAGSAECNYFDLKTVSDSLKNVHGDDFISKVDDIIFHKLKSEYVDISESRMAEWLEYKILYDPLYINVKEAISDILQKPLRGSQWLSTFNDPSVKNRYNNINDITNLGTLIKFLKQSHRLVIILDNVDRFSLTDQRIILDNCIHLSNTAEIPIVISIRTPNLRRLLSEGARGDFVFSDELNRIDARTFEIRELGFKTGDNELDRIRNRDLDYSIENLISSRIDFIKNNQEYSDYGKYLDYLINKYNWNFDKSAYISKFWNIFESLNSTFVKSEIYKFCNYNVRSILVMYFSLINHLVINHDEQYSFEALFPKGSRAQITELRNFLYKWILCSGRRMPQKSINLFNVFNVDDYGKSLVLLKILVYLSKFQENQNGLKYKALVDDFWRFGINELTLKRILIKLHRSQGYNDNSLLWVDKRDGDLIDQSTLSIMPAGYYFLDELSISRDYIFWMALITELDYDLIQKIYESKNVDYSQTNKVEYRTKVAYNFIEYILIPSFEKEVTKYKSTLRPPEFWTGREIEYYKSKFDYKNQVYLERLLNSILKSVPFANFPQNTQDKFIERGNQLLTEVKQLLL